MKIPEFLASLLPTFSKERIVEDINVTRGEITEYTAPAYAIAAPDFRNHKFKSDHMKVFLGGFDRQLGGTGFVGTIEKGFKTILENLDETKRLVEATYGEDVAGQGITYLKANLLQFVELVGFVSKYARKLLIYTYSAETEMYPESGTVFTDAVTPADIDWLKGNLQSFTTAFKIVTTNPSEFKAKIGNIPDVVVKQESASAVSATIGDAKLDPLSMKLIPVWLNPIYHVKMFVAEYQTNRYHEAKAELQVLQLHKLHLEKLREGKPDAALKKQIEYAENRINKISYKLAQMEKGNG